MRTVAAYKVDAFTDRALAGNAAGVVLDAAGLTEAEMKAVAREMNLSETAFFLPPEGKGDVRVRFFTPTGAEVDLCGDATIGGFHLYAREGRAGSSGGVVTLHQETKAGVLPVHIHLSGGVPERVTMGQAPPKFKPGPPARRAADALGLPANALDAALPVERAYTGIWTLLVPLRKRADLDAIDAAAVSDSVLALSKEQGIASVHAFTRETRERGNAFSARHFAPALGILEDPVTGTASGALGAYLVKHRVQRPGERIVGEQGDAIGRPGRVEVEVDGAPGDPRAVRVGGRAVVSFEGRMVLP
ncbi:MAG TPA: PhzF family phenazine biosynthesis protein [Candidatus Thermoplasmatota archaeon]|nr:PhzF family phenazine biosynthesis protein [Candidatus Thermoplasmatota archaeon]